ncbi:MAG: nucleotidyltransferase [Candidatus Cloacimonadota bacterium]|nr:MAG: nucleotidyltransferase [Candidatus Cloacimonadota bacterium]
MAVVVRIPYEKVSSFRIKFFDGAESSLYRDDFHLRRDYYDSSLENSFDKFKPFELNEFIIFKCIIGSRAYGLEVESSDTDLRGFYLPSADLHWSLYGVPEQLEDQQNDECYWEIEKFIKLALKANPNILECLYTPMIVKSSELANDLLEQRDIFLSKLLYQTYNGYVLNQFKRLNHKFSKSGVIKWKHAMHIIRLLLSGITAIQEGFVSVDISKYRDSLLSIKNGEVSISEVNKWRLSLHEEFEISYKKTSLPDLPNYKKANEFLIKARKQMVK